MAKLRKEEEEREAEWAKKYRDRVCVYGNGIIEYVCMGMEILGMCVWEWNYRVHVCVYGNGIIEYVCIGMEILGMCIWEWYVCMGMENWVYVYGYIMYTCYIFLTVSKCIYLF